MRLGAYANIPPVTKNLLIINVIVWLAMQIPSIGNPLFRYGALHYFTSIDFNVAQLLTYMFIHANFTHLFFNMFALWMFGMVIERRLGSEKFIIYYLSCGLGAALIQLGVFAIMISHYEAYLTSEMIELAKQGRYLPYEPASLRVAELINTPIVGASGAIYGVLLAFGMLYPNQRIYLYFIAPVKAKWVIIGYAAIELLQAIGNNAADNVAHVAHLGGMLIGVIIILWWRNNGTLNRYNDFY
ncbi:MAG: rhomboid family intramembrane serine protease [Muribaculaceae bacterium]|nr:rhomboid family intramembrane serine protease [Muribaculaceae bacterium]MDE6322146.1 rhomboid family intramembrane serine protease [Muribaculaceae bacterium]